MAETARAKERMVMKIDCCILKLNSEMKGVSKLRRMICMVVIARSKVLDCSRLL